jgi:WD40 repeat protein
MSVPVQRPIRRLGEQPRWCDGAPIVSLAIDPTGGRLAVASAEHIRLYDLVTGERRLALRELERLGGSFPTSQATFDADGRTVCAYACVRGRMALWRWNATTGEPIAVYEGDDVGSIIAIAPDRRSVLMATSKQRVVLWDLMANRAQRTIESAHAVSSASLSADRRRALLGGEVGELWDLERGELLRTYNPPRPTGMPYGASGEPQEIEGVAISPDGTLGLFGRGAFDCDAHTSLELVELDSGRVRARLRPPPNDQDGEAAPSALAFSRDGRYAAGGIIEAVLFDLGTDKAWQDEELQWNECVEALAFTDDGRFLVEGGDCGALRVIDVAARSMRTVSGGEAPGDRVSSVACDHDGRHALACADDLSFRLWNAEGGPPLRIWPDAGHPKAVAILPDTSVVDHTLRRWELALAEPQRAPLTDEGRAHAFAWAFDPNGRLLRAVTRYHDRGTRVESTLALHDAQTGLLIRSFAIPCFANVLAFDGTWAASGERKREPVQLYDVERGVVGPTLPARVGDVLAIGSGLVYVEVLRDELRAQHEVYDVEHGALVARLGTRDDLRFSALAMCPTRPLLAAATLPGSIIDLWDLRRGEIVCHLAGEDGPVRSLAFSADGRRLVSGGFGRVVCVWHVPD